MTTGRINQVAIVGEGKKKQEKDSIKTLTTKVEKAEKQLVMAFLGLENLFREIGQVYEALQENASSRDVRAQLKVDYLPEVAARLVLKGHPLELVDGDASSIPTTWIKAVFSKLSDILKDKRLLVLSVLGIQSSGKSTLLNTMFGLQFAVSAGRCTRGAYMQLVPVEESADLPFDYIVVIDSEGLRAPGDRGAAQEGAWRSSLRGRSRPEKGGSWTRSRRGSPRPRRRPSPAPGAWSSP